MTKKDELDRENYTVYTLFGITYLPHYTEKGMYVGPAVKAISGEVLSAIGATQSMMSLWKRAY